MHGVRKTIWRRIGKYKGFVIYKRSSEKRHEGRGGLFSAQGVPSTFNSKREIVNEIDRLLAGGVL